MSAFKVRELTREIQGRTASDALDIIAFSPKKAALFVGKTLKSAIANAENNAELKVETLVVKEATVGEGQTMKRIKSRARGSASPIRKRTSHIRIILTDEIEIVPSRSARAKLNGKAKNKTSKRPASEQGGGSKPEQKAPSVEPSIESSETDPNKQPDKGPGETAAAPKVNSDEDVTKS
jgi:large subunit ribosomal protein L22